MSECPDCGMRDDDWFLCRREQCAIKEAETEREELIRLRAEIERLTAERNALRDYAFEATKAITNLTVGGSEFFGKRIGEMYTADLPYCVEHIRVRMGYHMDAMRANARALAAEARAEKAVGIDWKFQLGDRVTKIKGSSWTGRVVGFYGTSLTPRGYAVESETETGSVQIYPEVAVRALASLPKESADAD